MIINEPVELEQAGILKWGFSPSKEKGTPGFWVEFQFTNIKSNDGNEWLTAKKTWWITEKTTDFFLRDMETLGWKGKDLSELDSNEPNAVNLTGNQVLITVEMKEYNGKMYPNVTYVNPLGYVPTNKKMDSKDIKSLAAKLKAKVAVYRAKNGSGAGKAPVKSASGSTVFPDVALPMGVQDTTPF